MIWTYFVYPRKCINSSDKLCSYSHRLENSVRSWAGSTCSGHRFLDHVPHQWRSMTSSVREAILLLLDHSCRLPPLPHVSIFDGRYYYFRKFYGHLLKFILLLFRASLLLKLSTDNIYLAQVKSITHR